MPAVLYGTGGDALTLTVGEHEVQRHVRQHHKVFKLAMDGKEQAIFLQQVQWDCLTDRPLHVDFLRIDLSQAAQHRGRAELPGAPGRHQQGQPAGQGPERRQGDVPAGGDPRVGHRAQVGHLDLSEKTTAGELELPEGVTLDMPPETSSWLT